MFVEINEKHINTRFISSMRKVVETIESETTYKIYYALINGSNIVEEFNSEADMNEKFEEVENAGGGSGGSSGLKVQVVNQLPQEGDETVLYLVPKTGTTGDVFEEYIWVNNNWELIGTTDIDLSNYYTKSETDTAISNAIGTALGGSY